MPLRALAAATLVVLVLSVDSADAGMGALNGGAAVPVGHSEEFLSTGFTGGFSYDWPVGRAFLGFEVGFYSWRGTAPYEAHLGQIAPTPTSSVDYLLSGIPAFVHVKVPLGGGKRTVPYVMGGLGFWRLEEDIEGVSEVHTRGGVQAGLGLSRAVTDRVMLGVEVLYHAIDSFVPHSAETTSQATQWVTVRVLLIPRKRPRPPGSPEPSDGVFD
jgi:opacity protein-like surface antigen